MKLQVRPLQVADVDEVFELVRGVYEAPQYPLGGRWNRITIERVIEGQLSFGGFIEGQLVGILLMRNVDKVWDIDLLAVHVGFRRQGLMQVLLQTVLMKKPVDTEVWLEVHEKNLAATCFYKKLGFQRVGKRPGYYHDGSSADLMNLR